MRVLLFLMIFCCSALGAEYGNVTVTKLIRVHDGDTFVCNIEGYPDLVGKEISVRIYGIDTPELNSKDPAEKQKAIDAREYLKKLLQGKIELRHIKRDKYFRILAEVYVDDKSISDEMIIRQLAKPYFGGNKALTWNVKR